MAMMNKNEEPVCPLCGDGRLAPHSELQSIKIGDEDKLIELQYSICDACESVIATPGQARNNSEYIKMLRKK
jgi:HTH-type transcriptional regulator/antitoxin MqsA